MYRIVVNVNKKLTKTKRNRGYFFVLGEWKLVNMCCYCSRKVKKGIESFGFKRVDKGLAYFLYVRIVFFCIFTQKPTNNGNKCIKIE